MGVLVPGVVPGEPGVVPGEPGVVPGEPGVVPGVHGVVHVVPHGVVHGGEVGEQGARAAWRRTV
jgi:hypothetical protein